MVRRIAILGDFNPAYATHHAINDCQREIWKFFRGELQFDWISTDVFNCETAFRTLYSGLWIAPGSPYNNTPNVMRTITYARKNRIPTFGNCAGFQYMLVEFAQNVCGMEEAGHQEDDPRTYDPVISKLECSLVGKEEEVLLVNEKSMIYKAHKKRKLNVKYFCNYGANPDYTEKIFNEGMAITALSSDAQVRAFELLKHPFYVGTLFQPALTSTKEDPDMLIMKFVEAAVKRKMKEEKAPSKEKKAADLD
jgi:CTP synthase (UTP-ammonia lyase)